jgi:hypothetical protein
MEGIALMTNDTRHMNFKEIPNAARVYDYVLGGSCNYDADRQAAEFMLSLVPSTRKWVRYLRRFLNATVKQLAGEGIDRFLDLASGLPTEDHIHTTAPEAKVVYVDNDSLVVQTGTEIIGNNPNARYMEADVRNIEEILASPLVREMIGDGRRVAVGLNAVTCFLTESEIQRIMHALYEWAPTGSKLYATFETKAPNQMSSGLQQLVDTFAQMGSPYHFLTLEKSKELVHPWMPDENGFQPLARALGVEHEVTDADREGVELEFYGAVLQK